jgi:hypothetical protein
LTTDAFASGRAFSPYAELRCGYPVGFFRCLGSSSDGRFAAQLTNAKRIARNSIRDRFRHLGTTGRDWFENFALTGAELNNCLAECIVMKLHVVNMDKYNLYDVFGVSAKHVASYYIRPEVDDIFKQAILSDKQIVVYGASKQGKTSLVSRYLNYADNIMVSLIYIDPSFLV